MSQFSANIEFKFSTNFNKVATSINKNIRKMKTGFDGLKSSIMSNKEGFEALNTTLRRGFLVGLAALSVAFGIATVKAQEYEKALAQLSAITGLTGENLANFGKESIAASNRFGVAASEYLEAVQLVASAKPELLDQPKLLKQITDEAAILSKAAGIDLRNAANALTDSMNQFELGAEDANRAINVLAAGSKFGASLVGDTAQALVKSGVAAKLAGLNFEETNAAIQILAQRGIRGAMAGTQLKGVFLTLNQVMKENNIPDVNTALGMLEKAMEGGADLTQLFGRENITAATILIESRKKVQDMTAAITGTNIAAEQAKVNMATFGERMARLKQTVVNALMQGFRPFIDVLGIIAEKLAVVFEWLGRHPKILTALIAGFAALVAILGALSLGVAIVMFKGLAIAMLAATGAVLSFTAALLANPITWIVIGVVALIAALAVLIAKWDNLRAVIVAVWKIYWSFYKAVWEGLKMAVIPALQDFWNAVKELAVPFQELFGIVDELFGDLAKSLGLSSDNMNILGTIGKAVGFAIGTAFRIALIPLRLLITLISMLVELGKSIGNVFVGNFDAALESLKNFVNKGKKLLDPFRETVGAVANFLGFGDDKPNEAKASAGSAANSAASLEAQKVVTKQSLDVNLKVDGPAKVEKIKSDKNLSTSISSGMLIPEGA
jgi:TP901 family phage tail tape measure protein